MAAEVVTPAHTQTTTIHLWESVPSHPTRVTDPGYAKFNAIRRAMAAQGKLVCVVCGKDEAAAGAPIQVHHKEIEFSLIPFIDWRKWAADHPEQNIQSQADFEAFCESPANLEPRCAAHHTGNEGIHVIPWPLVKVIKYLLDGIDCPFKAVTSAELPEVLAEEAEETSQPAATV